MDAADVLADFSQRLDRFARAVEDHVGRVKIDKQIRFADVNREIAKVRQPFLGLSRDATFGHCCRSDRTRLALR